MQGRRNIFGGLLLVFLGALFLLINFGYLGWDIWLVFLEFWPLMLVALGLRLIFRNHMVVQVLVFLMIFVFPLAYYLGFGSGTGMRYFPHRFGTVGYSTYNWAQDNDGGATEGNLNLDFRAGKITLEATDKLVDLNTEGYAGKPSIDVTRYAPKAEIAIKQASVIDRMPMMRIGGWSEDWNLGISKDVVWELNLSTGAVKGEFNLTEVKFKTLDVDTGAGDLRFIFGDAGISSEVDIDAGAGNITLVFPKTVGVKAKLSTGLGNKKFDGPTTWKQDNDTYTSSNYQEAAAKINIRVDHGAGNVSLIME